jgi:hypothetical protein
MLGEPLVASSVLTAALPGIFALAGVLGGAILAPVMNRRVDDRRELEAARRAWRLLRDDTSLALDEVRDRLDANTWPLAALHKDWSSVWRSSRGILIQYLDDDTYKSVARGFARMDRLESGVNTGRTPEDRGLDGNDRKFLEDMKARLESARATLIPEPLGPPRTARSRTSRFGRFR